jgi:hypothetical protein
MANNIQSPKYFTLTSPNASSDAAPTPPTTTATTLQDNDRSALPDIVSKALARAETMLKAIDAKYILVLPQGVTITHGDLTLAEPKKGVGRGKGVRRKRREEGVARGTYSDLVRAKGLESLAVGDSMKMEYEPFDPEAIRGAMSSVATRKWGNGSFITTRSGKLVELLRVK